MDMYKALFFSPPPLFFGYDFKECKTGVSFNGFQMILNLNYKRYLLGYIMSNNHQLTSEYFEKMKSGISKFYENQ